MANKKTVRAMLTANFDEWIHQPRTVLMFFFMLATTYITVYSYGKGIQSVQYEMHLGESLVWLLMNGFNGMSLASLTYLVAISEIPHQTSFLQYSLIRTSREKWCVSMLVYCILLAVAVMAVMLLLSALFLLPVVTAGTGWSDTLRTEAGMIEEKTYIPLWIRSNFAPWQAILLAICPILLFWIVITFSVLFFNLLGHPTIGLSLNAIILFSGMIFVFEDFPALKSPMIFTMLTRIVSGYEDCYFQRLTAVLIGYGLVLLCQMLLILWVVKKRDIAAYSDRKS
jgi:hypothetical protein